MIKITNPIRFLSAAALAIFLMINFSCSEDFFNEVPGDKITPESHYKTTNEVYVSYLGVFSLFQDVASGLIVTNGLLGDLVDVTENSDIHLRALNKHEFSGLNPYIDASGLYRIIIGANEVLANLDTNLIRDEFFIELGYDQYKSELVGLRSWAYFTLARLYGKVAYIPDNLPSLPEGQSLQYLSKEEMLDTLVQHLDSAVLAMDFYSLEYGINQHALLGDICLEKNDYDTAAYYLYMACSTAGNNSYKVGAQYSNENWSSIFVNSQDQDNTVMTAVPYSLDDQQINPLEQYTSYNLDYTIKPAQSIMDMYDKQVSKGIKDPPGDQYRGVGITYDTLASKDDGIFAINKYSIDVSNDFSAGVILYRAADVHLLFAEALNRKGEPENALLLVNDGYRTLPYWSRSSGVRGRVYLQNIELGSGGLWHIENLIMDERAMELAFEGKRWFDLMRIARRRNDPAYLADKIAAKFSGAEKDAVRERLMNMDNWYLPVQ